MLRVRDDAQLDVRVPEFAASGMPGAATGGRVLISQFLRG